MENDPGIDRHETMRLFACVGVNFNLLNLLMIHAVLKLQLICFHKVHILFFIAINSLLN